MPEPIQLEFDFPRKLEIHINENLLVEEQPQAQAQDSAEPWTPPLLCILAYMKTLHPANISSALRVLQDLTGGLCIRYLNSPSKELLLQGYVDIIFWIFYFEHLAMVEGGLDVVEIKKEMARRFEDKNGR